MRIKLDIMKNEVICDIKYGIDVNLFLYKGVQQYKFIKGIKEQM